MDCGYPDLYEMLGNTLGTLEEFMIVDLIGLFILLLALLFNLVISLTCIILFGWWIPVSDAISAFFDKGNAFVKIIVLPFYLFAFINLPFYGLAGISFLLLGKTKRGFKTWWADLLFTLKLNK